MQIDDPVVVVEPGGGGERTGERMASSPSSSSSSSSSSSRVWIPDEQRAWVKARVVRFNNDTTGTNTGNAIVRLEASGGMQELEVNIADVERRLLLGDGGGSGGLPLRNLGLPDDGAEDMCSLNYLHEPALLHNLQVRSARGLPYTYTGDICLSVNPYRWIDGLYCESRYQEYLLKERRDLSPHPFATSAAAFRGLGLIKFGEGGGADQSILVSGESGAGKTEMVKILLNHLAALGTQPGANASESEESGSSNSSVVVRRILEANPLLEAFGNAKTIRNDNSSRFGKFQQLVFASTGGRRAELVGADCCTYLLEKSRVVQQGEGERNYHIFYQLLSTSDPDLRARLRLPSQPADALALIRFMGSGHGGGFEVIEGRSDAEQFQRTLGALDVLGIDGETVSLLMEALSGILHMGQIVFEGVDGDDTDKSRIRRATEAAAAATEEDVKTVPPPLDSTASLLRIDADALASALCSRTVCARGETFSVPLSCEDAATSRDALAKATYARIFQWLVRRINRSTSAGERGDGGDATTAVRNIGLLDIFGFECLQRNSFEQLCINFTNEKLQQRFTQDIFKTVQAEYEDEGVPWTRITFRDNQDILDMIEGKLGILSLLDEECLRPKGEDEALVNKVTSLHGEHPNFSRARLQRTGFQILHFAGPVDYDATGFLVKNRDPLQSDLVSLVHTSRSPLLSELFSPAFTAPTGAAAAATAAAAGSHSRRRRKSMARMVTVGNEFKLQLTSLMESIVRTEVQYVRCIKPNALKRPDAFDHNSVVEQLRCAGVIAAIRISRAAFPNRLPIADFLGRFWMLFPSLSCGAAGGKAAVSAHECAVRASRREVGGELCREALDLIVPPTHGEAIGDAGGGERKDGEQPPRRRYFVARTKIYFESGILEDIECKRTLVVCAKATAIQCQCRGASNRRRYRLWRRGLLAAQSALRGCLARRNLARLRRVAIVAQALARGLAARRRVTAMRRNRSATTIQAHLRRSVSRRFFRLARASIVRLQSRHRCRIARAAFVVRLHEAREESRMENQIAALKRRLQAEENTNRRLADELELRESMIAPRPPTVGEERPTGDTNVSALELLETLQRENGNLKTELQRLRMENSNLKTENQTLRAAKTMGADRLALSERERTRLWTTRSPPRDDGGGGGGGGQDLDAQQFSTPPRSAGRGGDGAVRRDVAPFSETLRSPISGNVVQSSAPTLSRHWTNVPFGEIESLATEGSADVHIKCGNNYLYVEDGWLQWRRICQSDLGVGKYRRNMCFHVELIGSDASASVNAAGESYIAGATSLRVRSAANDLFLGSGGFFQRYCVPVKHKSAADARGFLCVPCASRSDAGQAGADETTTIGTTSLFSLRSASNAKFLTLKDDGYVVEEGIASASGPPTAFTFEVLKPCTRYELEFDQQQLGLRVSLQMPLTVVGLNEVGPDDQPGTAERCGRVHKDDIIVAADGIDVTQLSRKDAIAQIMARRPVVLTFLVGTSTHTHMVRGATHDKRKSIVSPARGGGGGGEEGGGDEASMDDDEEDYKIKAPVRRRLSHDIKKKKAARGNFDEPPPEPGEEDIAAAISALTPADAAVEPRRASLVDRMPSEVAEDARKMRDRLISEAKRDGKRPLLDSLVPLGQQKVHFIVQALVGANHKYARRSFEKNPDGFLAILLSSHECATTP